MVLALMVMLLSKTLGVIMFDYTKLINNIKRSEFAYQLYCESKKYHQALHIFYANQIVYDELNGLLEKEELSDGILKLTINYLFHLEDWFLQFSILEVEIISPEQDFSFLPLEDNISYPANFLEAIKK